MDLILHNTLSGKREVFTPQDPSRVTMYACGPTVYNYAHIGNARPAGAVRPAGRGAAPPLSRRVYARNITDVDDKINDSARELGVPIEVITDRFTQAYHEDMAALGVQRPDIEPRATADHGHDHRDDPAPDRVGSRLTKPRATCCSRCARFAAYGKLSGRAAEEQLAGARVDAVSLAYNIVRSAGRLLDACVRLRRLAYLPGLWTLSS
jgi:cysteinyl-tRNA synthetase